MNGFQYYTPTKVVFGKDTEHQAGALVREFGGTKVLVKWKGVIPAGQVRDELISTIDFPVTLLDAAGMKFTRNQVDGQSILPLVTGKPVKWREDLMSETQGHGYGEDVMARVIRYKNWKYVITKDDLEELYDLEKDVFELHNLAENSEFQNVLEDMRARLAKWQRETGDPFKMR